MTSDQQSKNGVHQGHIRRNQGPVALGDKNFVSSAKFQEKFWFNKFLLQNVC